MSKKIACAPFPPTFVRGGLSRQLLAKLEESRVLGVRDHSRRKTLEALAWVSIHTVDVLGDAASDLAGMAVLHSLCMISMLVLVGEAGRPLRD